MTTLSGIAIPATTIIARALRILDQLESGELPTTQEYADGLDALNAMLDSWRNEGLMCISTLDQTINMVASQSSYTVGTGGDLSTDRPVRINGAYVVYQSITYPITIYTDVQYDAIPYKAQQSNFPQIIYCSQDMPSVTIYPYPVPNAVSALHIITWQPLYYYATSATTAVLPPGWYEALCTNLAIKQAPEYQVKVSQDLTLQAREAKANIKRANNKTPIAQFDNSLLAQRRYNVITGFQ